MEVSSKLKHIHSGNFNQLDTYEKSVIFSKINKTSVLITNEFENVRSFEAKTVQSYAFLPELTITMHHAYLCVVAPVIQ